jgi:hypothetical protein
MDRKCLVYVQTQRAIGPVGLLSSYWLAEHSHGLVIFMHQNLEIWQEVPLRCLYILFGLFQNVSISL